MFQTAEIDILPDPVRHPAYYEHVPAKRLMAWVIDTVLIAFLTAVLIPFTGFLALFFLGGLYLVVSFLFRWVTLARMSATPGMAMMGLEMRDARGRRFDAGMGLIHTLGYSVSVAFVLPQLVSIALMLITPRRQGLSDLVLGSVVMNRGAAWAQ